MIDERRPESLSYAFVVGVSCVILFMNLGFAMLEVGYLGFASNKSPILLKVCSIDTFLKVNPHHGCPGPNPLPGLATEQGLVQNFMSFAVAMSAWLSLGYGLFNAEGVSLFGTENIFFMGLDYEQDPSRLLFTTMLVTVSSGLVNGAVAGRIDVRSHLLLTALSSGIIFPIVARSAWHRNGVKSRVKCSHKEHCLAIITGLSSNDHSLSCAT
jgi:ammonia channel protein AmtB